MIKGINSSSRYIAVSGGMAASPYISPGSVGAGMMRWNSNMNCMEVNDGNMWKTIDMGYATVELTPDAESLLEWARKKRDQENEWYKIASTNEAVRIALDQLEQAKTRLELTTILSRDYEQTTS
jgi:hypothetical protein